jgi:predicted metal-dependent HD superfamily phosphohydrolase
MTFILRKLCYNSSMSEPNEAIQSKTHSGLSRPDTTSMQERPHVLTEVDHQRMLGEFKSTIRAFNQESSKADIHRSFYTLLGSYLNQNRSYHTHTHILDLLNKANLLESAFRDVNTVKLAIWFHDMYYKPGSPDNEAISAEHAREHLTDLGISPEIIEKVVIYILATTGHFIPQEFEEDHDLALFLDLDMSILGADPAEYDQYAEAIRRECSAIPQNEYHKNCAAFLENELSKDIIFHTKEMGILEEKARENMKRELNRIGKWM